MTEETKEKVEDKIYTILYKNSTVDGVRVLYEDEWPLEELTQLVENVERNATERYTLAIGRSVMELKVYTKQEGRSLKEITLKLLDLLEELLNLKTN